MIYKQEMKIKMIFFNKSDVITEMCKVHIISSITL